MTLDKITVMGKVTYKQVVTPLYKEKSLIDVDREVEKLEKELADFDEKMNKTITELTIKGHPQLDTLRQQFNLEREKIVIYINQLKETKEAIAVMDEGVEVPAGEGNFVTELKVGEAFTGNLDCEVIVKDDIVTEIRNG